MKLIFFAPYYTSKFDAASRKVDQLLEISLSLGYSVTFFSCSKCTTTHQNLTQIKLKSRPGRFAGFWRMYVALKLWSLYTAKNIIISDFNPFIQLPSRARLIHIIHHINDYPSLGRTSFGFVDKAIAPRLPDLFESLWRAYLYLSPNRVITVSNAVGQEIKQVLPSKSVYVVYNSLQFASADNARPRLDETKQSFSIVMVGHNVPRKNYPFAIESLAALSSVAGDQFACTIVGNNVHLLRPQLEKFSLLHRVQLCSNLSASDLSIIYSQSCLFLSTSLQEGFCIPYVEAQYHSCSTLTPSQPVFHELAFGNNHFFRNGSTPSDVADTAYEILAKASVANRSESSSLKMLPHSLSKQAITQQFKSSLELPWQL
jgi:glycosyltransferase involved in cell wall biosynthesis